MQMTTTQMKERQEERMSQFKRLSQGNKDESMQAARESLLRAGLIDKQGQPSERYR